MGQRLALNSPSKVFSFLLQQEEKTLNININTNKIVHTKISSCDYCDKILIDSKENICSLCEEQLVLKRLQMIGIFN